MKSYRKLPFIMTCLILSALVHADDEPESVIGQNSQAPRQDIQTQGKWLELSPAQTSLIKLKVSVLNPRIVEKVILAPGEIEINADASQLIVPMVDSIIVARSIRLGEYAEKSQALVTLFSDGVADAQAQYLVDLSEWQRVAQLGRKAVGENRYITTKTQYEASLIRLRVFGLSDADISSLPSNTAAFGQYILRAGVAGIVLNDDFQLGQRVSAGEPLIQLADETTLWVSVKLVLSKSVRFSIHQTVEVVSGGKRYPATLIQQAQSLDAQTRTREMRLLVDNSEKQLYPGQFVDVQFLQSSEKALIVVPESALMRSSDGDWTLFVEESPGKFVLKEVTLGQSFDDEQEVLGIAAGTRVVTDGAFYLASELAKSSFGDND